MLAGVTMIQLTRLNGSAIVINAEMIEMMESTPDTHITLIGGDKFLVKESMKDIIERVVEYKNRVFKNLVFFRQEAEP
jgi:flagellar protein FlbD